MTLVLPAVETLCNNSQSAALSFESSTCDDLHHCRTIWNIIWSCLVTLFACIWLAIHMNIPAPEDSVGTRLARRVWIMVLALLAPELIVGWAARQREAAYAIAKENQKHKWSKTHGFFVVMGGFMKCENGKSVRTLEHGGHDIPEEDKKNISEADIRDKSKGDVLSKGFALLQTGWFILQCISRKISGLPTTQLEIATVAFAALNFATYILWWNKPLGVREPVRVSKSKLKGLREGEAENDAVEAQDEERAKDGWIRKLWKEGLVDFLKEVHRPIAEAVEEYGWSLIWLFPLAPFIPIMNGSRLGSNVNKRRVGTFSPDSPYNVKHLQQNSFFGVSRRYLSQAHHF